MVFGDKVNEGQLVEGVAVPWFEILRELARNPEFLFQIGWRQLEEFLAGAYERAGWPQVILTPRSGDGGRDIIATKPGIGSIRLFDHAKAYKPGHLVTAEEVRAMLGVLQVHPNVSKGIITTTSRFAPGVEQEFQAFMPYRLELKNGAQLLSWLAALQSAASPSGPSPEGP